MTAVGVVDQIADVLHRDWCSSTHHNACGDRVEHDRRRARLITEVLANPGQVASPGWLEIYADVDADLLRLAEALTPRLADRLTRLVDASSRVHRVVELENKLQRADDLERELRRQLASQARQLEQLRATPVRKLNEAGQ